MRVAVLGANGQLGRDIVEAFSSAGHQVTGFTHDDLEVSSLDSVNRGLNDCQPDLVINTAAFHQVEKCEADPVHAYAVNGLGARNVAQVTHSLGAKLVHVSTDYVFDGNKGSPYTENDIGIPLNVYGNTKLAGENFVRTVNPYHFVVRVSAIYGASPCRAKGGLNFVETMLKLSREREQIRVVADEFVTPTPSSQIAAQLLVLGQTSEYGLYHATAEGSCSWYEFAKTVFECTGTKIRLEPARPGEFPAKVPRPKYSVLENAALKCKSLNIFTHWSDGLRNYLARRDQTSVLSV